MTVLTKTTRVYEVTHAPEFAWNDEGEAMSIIHLNDDTYEDMGRPERITVTVEPGDRLNP